MKEGVKDHYRVNERIRARSVRLIDHNGTQVGVVQRDRAIQMAREQGLDLVEVAATTDPPVCKILDFGKFIYELKKKAKDSRKNKHALREKEIVMRPNIDKHDASIKINHARELLVQGHKVIFKIKQRGREVEHSEIGRGHLENIKKELANVSKVEKDINAEGKLLFLTLSPKIGGQIAKEKDKQGSSKQIPPNAQGQSPLPQGGQGSPAAGQNP